MFRTERSVVVTIFQSLEPVGRVVNDLQEEGFEAIGILVAGTSTGLPAFVDAHWVHEHTMDSIDNLVVIDIGMAELNPGNVHRKGVAGVLEQLGLPQEEAALCLDAMNAQSVVVIVRCDDRYSEALAILNVQGATDAIRELTP